jgi:DNA-binding phage protein
MFVYLKFGYLLIPGESEQLLRSFRPGGLPQINRGSSIVSLLGFKTSLG